MNCELVPRTAQLRLRTVILLYHGTAAAAAAIAAASRHIWSADIEYVLSCCGAAVRLSSHAIILSLPRSSFELIPLIITTHRTLGFRLKVISLG